MRTTLFFFIISLFVNLSSYAFANSYNGHPFKIDCIERHCGPNQYLIPKNVNAGICFDTCHICTELCITCNQNQTHVPAAPDHCCGHCIDKCPKEVIQACNKITTCETGFYISKANHTLGQCCDMCVSCSTTSCPDIDCGTGYTVEPADSEHCCPRCMPDCRVGADCPVFESCPLGEYLDKADGVTTCCDTCLPCSQSCTDMDCGTGNMTVPADSEHCCPYCVPDCRLTADCPVFESCPFGETLVKADGITTCCDKCLTCSQVSCPDLQCPTGEVMMPGNSTHCCPYCIPDCRLTADCPVLESCPFNEILVKADGITSCCDKCVTSVCTELCISPEPTSCKTCQTLVQKNITAGICCTHCETEVCDTLHCDYGEEIIPADINNGKCCSSCEHKHKPVYNSRKYSYTY
jgi:hypothetical protein